MTNDQKELIDVIANLQSDISDLQDWRVEMSQIIDSMNQEISTIAENSKYLQPIAEGLQGFIVFGRVVKWVGSLVGAVAATVASWKALHGGLF